jgi:hypothetical protein
MSVMPSESKNDAKSGKQVGKVGKNNPPVEHQFKPGYVPPGGRPKGSVSVVKYIKQLLEANEDEQAKKLAQALILQAAKGNGAALKQILDRVDGPVKQEMEVTGSMGVEIAFQSAVDKAYGDNSD